VQRKKKYPEFYSNEKENFCHGLSEVEFIFAKIILMKKKILYLDMDGVVADFEQSVLKICPELNTASIYEKTKKRDAKIDQICATEPNFFHNLLPMKGAVEAVNQLFPLYNLYFLSSPMWGVPESYIGKRIWIEKHFGVLAKKRLILSHRKDLHLGDYLVDDRTRNGAGEFQGFHIHFGTEAFPDWETTLRFLVKNC
jgi:5'(3')-deoxyribonucleotidase